MESVLRSPGWLSSELAIDLGTSNTRIYARGQGIVATAPSVVAVRKDRRGHELVVAVGGAADEMAGRTPRGVSIVRPLQNGVIADLECAQALLGHLAPPGSVFAQVFGRRVAIAVPTELTRIERRVFRECMRQAGARDVLLVDAVIAAAIGAGLPVDRASGNLILDIGGGRAEVAVVSLFGVVSSSTPRASGAEMDEVLKAHLRQKHGVLIGDHTAELIKTEVATAHPTDDTTTLELTGRDLSSGAPRPVRIESEEIREALAEPIAAIVKGVERTLESTPPELGAEIAERGITMVGGGCLLSNLDALLCEVTGLPAARAEDPMAAVAHGLGRIIDDPELYRHLASSSTC